MLFVRVTAVVGASLALLIAPSCSKKKEYAGIGPWLLNKTTRGEVGGLCKPLKSGIVFCYGGPLSKRSFTIPGHDRQADVSLYFKSDDPSAPLIELEVEQTHCEPLAMQAWVDGKFGDKTKATAEKTTWKGRHAFTALVVKPAERLCKLHIVQLGDTARIKKLE